MRKQTLSSIKDWEEFKDNMNLEYSNPSGLDVLPPSYPCVLVYEWERKTRGYGFESNTAFYLEFVELKDFVQYCPKV